MVKIRVYYENQKELSELIRLLSPRLNYVKTYPEKKCILGIETSDLTDDLVNETTDEDRKTLDFLGDTPINNTEGGKDNV